MEFIGLKKDLLKRVSPAKGDHWEVLETLVSGEIYFLSDGLSSLLTSGKFIDFP